MQPKLYLSLTTIPTRINNIDKLLHSISKQTLQPDKIIIHYPRYCIRLQKYYDIHPLQDIIKRSILRDKIVVNHTKDYGPITKIYPIADVDYIQDNDAVIVIDDDNYYHPLLFELLYKEFIRYKCQEAICISGVFYPRNINNLYHIFSPGRYCELMEAWAGYIIKKSFLKHNLRQWTIANLNTIDSIKKNYMWYSFLSDDYIISRYLDKYNIRKRVVSYFPQLNRTNCSTKLQSTNSLGGSSYDNFNHYIKSEYELIMHKLFLKATIKPIRKRQYRTLQL